MTPILEQKNILGRILSYATSADWKNIMLVNRTWNHVAHGVFDFSTNNNYPLRWSCSNGNLDAVRHLLLDARVDPTSQNSSALTSAVKKGYFGIVDLLLEHPKMQKIDSRTLSVLLLESVTNNNTMLVEKLLKTFPFHQLEESICFVNFERIHSSEEEEYRYISEALINQNEEMLHTLLRDSRVRDMIDPEADVKLALQSGNVRIAQWLMKQINFPPERLSMYPDGIEPVGKGGMDGIDMIRFLAEVWPEPQWKEIYRAMADSYNGIMEASIEISLFTQKLCVVTLNSTISAFLGNQQPKEEDPRKQYHFCIMQHGLDILLEALEHLDKILLRNKFGLQSSLALKERFSDKSNILELIQKSSPSALKRYSRLLGFAASMPDSESDPDLIHVFVEQLLMLTMESFLKRFNIPLLERHSQDLRITSKEPNIIINSIMDDIFGQLEGDDNYQTRLKQIEELDVQYKLNDAFSLTKQYAEEGDPNFQLSLANRFKHGLGTLTNHEQAFEWCFKASAQGLPEAQRKLAHCYQKGRGVKKSCTKAEQWLRKAAKREYAPAQLDLGLVCEGSGRMATAIKWYSKAANHGCAAAQCILGALYYSGEGVEKDYKKAFQWFLRASEQKYPAAITNLGLYYAHVKNEIDMSYYFFAQAAELGDEAAIKVIQDAEKSLGPNDVLVYEFPL